MDDPIPERWSTVLEKAIRDDGSLLFPERLTHAFLSQARRTMGSYLFSNNYMNEIIPQGEQTFKRAWVKYWMEIPRPDELFNFCFIDPAIGETKAHDFTALVVVSVDVNKNWYVRVAERRRINPSQIIDWCFHVHKEWACKIIGIEDVAFQRAIVHFAMEESKRRGVHLPVTGVKHGPQKSKQTRILGLVPRFEWGTLWLRPNLTDLELELAQFPRGKHDDLLDALSSVEEIVHYPQPIRRRHEAPAPNDPAYETWYRRQLHRRQGNGQETI